MPARINNLTGGGLTEPFQPTAEEVKLALEGGEIGPQTAEWLHQSNVQAQAERRAQQSRQQEEWASRQQQLERLQPEGDLWLHTANGPAMAVASDAQLLQGAFNNNKVVLGPAGSGRNLLLGRLARAAHEGGNQVVVVTTTPVNPNNPGPLWMLTHTLGGSFRSIQKPNEQRFNPFLMPGGADGKIPLPTLEQLNALSNVLVSVLSLTRHPAAMPREGVLQALEEVLGDYFMYQAELADHYPCFANFSSYMIGNYNRLTQSADLYDWLAAVSPSFLPGGVLEGVMAATYNEVHLLLMPGSSNSILHITLAADEHFPTGVDCPHFSDGSGNSKTAQTQARLLLLLLHSVDMHFGAQAQRLTIIADELPPSMLGAEVAAFLRPYLHHADHYNRELLTGWHQPPTSVFNTHNPAAELILYYAGTQLLLALSSANEHVLASYAPVGLTEEELDLLSALQHDQRQVLIRRPLGTGVVFSAALARQALTDFVPERILKLRK